MPEWLPGAGFLIVLVVAWIIRVPATLHANIIVRRSVADSFNFVANPVNTPTWNPRIKLVTITDGQLGVGTKYQLHIEGAGTRVTLAYEVVEYEPPIRFAAETKTLTMTNRFEYRFEATDAGTRITGASKARVPLLQALVIRAIGASRTKRNLSRMKAAIEGNLPRLS